MVIKFIVTAQLLSYTPLANTFPQTSLMQAIIVTSFVADFPSNSLLPQVGELYGAHRAGTHSLQ